MPLSRLRFQVYQDAGGEWRWRAKAGNGLIVADGGQGYQSRSNVERALERLVAMVNEIRVLGDHVWIQPKST